MAVHAAGGDSKPTGWRPRPLGVLLIAIADFCGAVGAANLFLGQPAKVWLFAAAALLLAGVSTSD